MCQFEYFVCPIRYSHDLEKTVMSCSPSSLFQLQEYDLPEKVASILKVVCITLLINLTLMLITYFHSI